MSADVKGTSGNTPADLREVAAVWDKSAEYCDTCGEPELASRDRRFASALREAADILETAELPRLHDVGGKPAFTSRGNTTILD